MILRYLRHGLDRVKSFALPKHPQRLRDWILPDGTHVVADSGDDTQFDLDDIARTTGSANAPSVTDLYKSGKLETRPRGSMADVNVLTAAEFSQLFVAQFNLAGQVRDLPKESVETPKVETPKVETPKTE